MLATRTEKFPRATSDVIPKVSNSCRQVGRAAALLVLPTGCARSRRTQRPRRAPFASQAKGVSTPCASRSGRTRHAPLCVKAGGRGRTTYEASQRDGPPASAASGQQHRIRDPLFSKPFQCTSHPIYVSTFGMGEDRGLPSMRCARMRAAPARGSAARSRSRQSGVGDFKFEDRFQIRRQKQLPNSCPGRCCSAHIRRTLADFGHLAIFNRMRPKFAKIDQA